MKNNRQISVLRELSPSIFFALCSLLVPSAGQAQQVASGSGISVRTWSQRDFSGADAGMAGQTYGLTERLSIETYFRSPSAQILEPSGLALRAAPYATVGQTVMGQYRFGEAKQDFRPRLGAGLAYALSRSDRGMGIASALHGEGAEFSRSSAGRELTGMGLALEVGASYALSKSWYLEGSVMKSYIRSTGSALNSPSGGAAPGLKIDPLMFTFSVGFRFQ